MAYDASRAFHNESIIYIAHFGQAIAYEMMFIDCDNVLDYMFSIYYNSRLDMLDIWKHLTFESVYFGSL